MTDFTRISLLLPFCFGALFLLVSCEPPEMGSSSRSTPEPVAVEEPAKLTEENSRAVNVAESEELVEAVEQPESELEEGEDSDEEYKDPVLRVYRSDGNIVLVGALKSRLQIERIESEMGEAFSGTRIDNRLELDFKRHPVGWGNRVSRDFLIPYFKSIEEPFVEYVEGVITLSGYGSKRDFREFQQLATTVFAGAASRTINNDITEKVEPAPEEKQ